MTTASDQAAQIGALQVIRDRLTEAASARKCHGCGCLHDTVAAFEGTDIGTGAIADVLAQTRSAFVPREYDCLGCAVCYPAIAAGAFADAFPAAAGSVGACPTDTPVEREGWPPLPGDYLVVRYHAPVAVCALNSYEVMQELAALAPEGLAVVGTLHTENLGIERVIRNVLANPHIRSLVLCGEDTRQVIGHLPGQTLASLFANGLDERGRVRGAQGKRPFLKNVTREQVAAFLRQVELVSLIGETNVGAIAAAVARCAVAAPGPFDSRVDAPAVPMLVVQEPATLTPDPAGYFVVYPDPAHGRLFVEHYTNAGVLNCMLEGAIPAAIYTTAIERGLVTRLDHVAYLGRELARAEESLRTGLPYTQDRAAGELVAPVSSPSRLTAGAEARVSRKEVGCCSSNCECP